MSKGVFTFKGGTDQLVKRMHQEMKDNGVDSRINCSVESVNVERGKVKSVTVNGREINAKAVISNANLSTTIFKMVGAEKFDKDFLDEARDVRLNSTSTQVYMSLKEGEQVEHSTGDLLFSSTSKEFSTDKLLSREITSRTFSFYYPDLRPNPKNRCFIVSSTNANYEDWSTLSKEDYEESKRELVENTLDALEEYVPNCREKIDHAEAATPLTFEHYTRHERGSSFGTKFEGLGVSRGLPEQIQGLYHAGSCGIIMSGWLGTINYGVIVANDVDSLLMKQASSVS